jgi:hypothetical protein
MTCEWHERGAVEQYSYGELGPAERERFEAHVDVCAACRAALDDLRSIARALDGRPRLDAPPGGDWTSFMDRLDGRIAREVAAPGLRSGWLGRGPVRSALKLAAMVALVTAAVFTGRQWERVRHPADTAPAATDGVSAPEAVEALAERHLERSKLVLLGLATKDPRRARPADWRYERDLASSMLADTTQYRLAARQQGLDGLAGVLGDLEVVLLQTSLSDDADPGALARLQTLIDKRDLLVKIEVIGVIDRKETARPPRRALPAGTGA